MTSMPLDPRPVGLLSAALQEPEPDRIAGFEVQRVADLQLRGPGRPLRSRVYWPVRPALSPAPALLLFFHAGGYFPGSVRGADLLCRGLCARAGMVVLSAAHRMTPQDPYPAAFCDATIALEWAADHAAELEADPGRLIVAGEGAGGNLAAALALSARDQQWPQLTRQVLIYPNLDAWQDSPSYREHAGAPLNGAAAMRRFYREYLRDDAATEDPYASPLHAASVAGLPAATVVTVEYDPLRDDGRRYAARLRQAGVEVTELRYDDLAHGALALLSWGGAAERLLDDLARSLRS